MANAVAHMHCKMAMKTYHQHCKTKIERRAHVHAGATARGTRCNRHNVVRFVAVPANDSKMETKKVNVNEAKALFESLPNNRQTKKQQQQKQQ